MTAKQTKILLSRIAKFVGLKLIEVPANAYVPRKYWCFLDGFYRFTPQFFSLKDMMKYVLDTKNFGCMLTDTPSSIKHDETHHL